MVRVVTQETYDEVVKENIEEFEMSPEDAIKEAVAQFEAQGVNLANIIKDLALGGGDSHLVTSTMKKLKELSGENSDEEIIKELDILKEECKKDIAHRMKAGKDGAYNILIDLLEARQKVYLQDKKDKDAQFMMKVLECLCALMDTQPDLLDARGIELIKSILDNTDNEDVLISALKWTTNCLVKHELNKQKLFVKDIGSSMKRILLTTKNLKVISECLQVMRKFTLDDDVRLEFGKAHEHSRDLGILLLEPLTKLLKENTKPPLVSELMLTIAALLVRHELCRMVADCGVDILFTVLADNYDDTKNTKPPLVSELMLTIAALLVRHELCRMVADCGVDILFTVLADNYDNVAVAMQGNKLVTALAGHDDVKRDLVRSGIVPIIISILNRHNSNAAASAYALKCVAALTLREPAHSQQFLENGVPEAIVECIKIHPENASVQKNACWAIRNMVARCRSHNAIFHELGIEPLLNSAYDKFSDDFGFDIKSALRDLDCDVRLDEQWTGRGVQMDQ